MSQKKTVLPSLVDWRQIESQVFQHDIPGCWTCLARWSNNLQHKSTAIIADCHQFPPEPLLLLSRQHRKSISAKTTRDWHWKEIDNLGERRDKNLLSRVLLLEWGRAGLWGGRLRGPSMLLDIIEEVLVAEMGSLRVDGTASATILDPGVLEADLWCFGDDGALPTVLRVLKTEDFR